ncbi:MAG TPA: DMT family transporter [Nocardioidaceae bacterium]|nr:DMT family transporter [Nocardioidaceae bacterium]
MAGDGRCDILAAILVAIVSAFGFSLSTSLQHRDVGRVPDHVQGASALMRSLAARPLWVLGLVIGLAAFGLHALALDLGTLPFVQPIICSGVVFAVPLRAWMDRERPHLPEVGAVTLAVVGLVVLLIATNATPNQKASSATSVLVFDAVLVVLVLLIGHYAERLSPRGQALVLGSTAGAVYGVVAGNVKTLLDNAAHGGFVSVPVALLAAFLVVFGIIAMILNQRAYRAAPLSMSMPILNLVDVLVAELFSWGFLGVPPWRSAALAVVQVVGLALMWFGVRAIVRVHEKVDRDRLLGDATGTATRSR